MAYELTVSGNASNRLNGNYQYDCTQDNQEVLLFDEYQNNKDALKSDQQDCLLEESCDDYEVRLQQVKDEQGFSGKAIDFVKGIFGFGSKKLDSQKEQVKNGTMSEDEFLNNVEEYEKNQENLVAGAGNYIAGGLGAVAAAMIPGVGWGLLGGALVGAGAKFLISFVGDEMSNKTKDDATLSQGIKESAIGAVNGFLGAGAKMLGDKLIGYLGKPHYKIDPWTHRKYETLNSQIIRNNSLFSKIFNEFPSAAFVGVGTGIVSGLAETKINNEEITKDLIANNVVQDMVPFGDLYVFD